MYNNKKIIAIIPARDGSKGLPGKNIIPLLGKPLISWTIEQALASALIDTVMVSTDDHNIRSIAQEAGANVPFLRPSEFSKDDSSSSDVIIHTLDYYSTHLKTDFDILCLLQPTNPIRYPSDIDSILKSHIDTPDTTSTITTLPSSHYSPFWSYTLNQHNYLEYVLKESLNYINKGRQHLPKTYFPTGTMFVSHVHSFRTFLSFMQPQTRGFEVKEEQFIDIDNDLDFYLAECIAKKYLNHKYS